MKRMHKLTALLLTLLLALMMTACGGTADDGVIDDGGFDDGTVDDGGFDGDVQTGGDYTGLAGDWYLDGDPGAESILVIAADGSWELYERPGGDGDPAQVDGGALRDGGGDGLYYADSTEFEGVAYDMQVVDEGTLYWGGEYDCYMRAQ